MKHNFSKGAEKLSICPISLRDKRRFEKKKRKAKNIHHTKSGACE